MNQITQKQLDEFYDKTGRCPKCRSPWVCTNVSPEDIWQTCGCGWDSRTVTKALAAWSRGPTARRGLRVTGQDMLKRCSVRGIDV